MSQNYTVKVLSGKYRPRQFEFHPLNSQLIFGTIKGNICTVSLDEKNSPISFLGNYGSNPLDAILGLCWMRMHPYRFISGSTSGRLTCGDTRNHVVNESIVTPVKEYDRFNRLTSVHVNSENRHLLVSGYSNFARIYDVETGNVIHVYSNAHESHINISRFSNLSPCLFATSSFDGTAKAWDTRISSRRSIYSVACNSGIVMINFSPDDNFLLASALDNEITQFLTVDGKKHTVFDVPKTGVFVLSLLSF